MTLSIIIVHYKTLDLTLRCLRSVYSSVLNFEFEVIVVDNASNDGILTLFENEFPQIKWVVNEKNDGFGRANNLGVQVANGKYILLLNSDMVLQIDSLQKTVLALNEVSNLGVYGCELRNEDGSLQKSRYYDVDQFRSLFKTTVLFDYFFTFKNEKLDGVMGAFFVMERSVFLELKGFDPDFFMYAEELELCLRVKDLGKEIVFDPSFFVVHKHGGSSTGSVWSHKQSLASSALLFYKRKGFWGYLLYLLSLKMCLLLNFIVLWRMDKNYRTSFWIELRLKIQLIPTYLSIPLYFSRKRGREDGSFLRVQ